VIHRDTVRAAAWEAAVCPERFNPVEALINIAFQAEDGPDGQRIIKTFAEQYTDTLGHQYRDLARKLKEELDND
jgi:hypothetical protein